MAQFGPQLQACIRHNAFFSDAPSEPGTDGSVICFAQHHAQVSPESADKALHQSTFARTAVRCTEDDRATAALPHRTAAWWRPGSHQSSGHRPTGRCARERTRHFHHLASAGTLQLIWGGTASHSANGAAYECQSVEYDFAAHQADPLIDGIQLDYFVGDGAERDGSGVDPFRSAFVRSIAGPLAMALALEGVAVLNIWLYMTNKWRWQTGWKLLGQRPREKGRTAA